MVFLDLRFLQQQLKVSGSSNVTYNILFYKRDEEHIFSPYKQQLEMNRKEENLTKNHTTLMVSEIHARQSIKFVHE
jgi:hypothetical protein